MSRSRKTSSNDKTATNGYQDVPLGVNNSKPVWMTSKIVRSEKHVKGVHEWSQVWIKGQLVWDSRTFPVSQNVIKRL